MPKLILLRHLQSQWNLENRFAGWTDVALSEEGIKSAKEVTEKLSNSKIDVIYTSPLKRNRSTVQLVLEHLNRKNIPVIVDKALDERNYGELQGLNKDEVKKQYGEEQVKLWRRGWNQAPPGGESLKTVFKRVVSFYEKNIEKDLKKGKNVLVVASHNSLRALVKHLERIPDKDIINLEIPTASLREYDF
ncbi:MAG: 2,3-diphosphoglycerate-dependent phosphoglycerate mutase [Candidatus Portnoybacteria bacterium]